MAPPPAPEFDIDITLKKSSNTDGLAENDPPRLSAQSKLDQYLPTFKQLRTSPQTELGRSAKRFKLVIDPEVFSTTVIEAAGRAAELMNDVYATFSPANTDFPPTPDRKPVQSVAGKDRSTRRKTSVQLALTGYVQRLYDVIQAPLPLILLCMLEEEFTILKALFVNSKMIGAVHGRDDGQAHKPADICIIPKSKRVKTEFRFATTYDVLYHRLPAAVLPHPTLSPLELKRAWYDWAIWLFRVDKRHPFVGGIDKVHQVNRATKGRHGYGEKEEGNMKTPSSQGILTKDNSISDLHQRGSCLLTVRATRHGIKQAVLKLNLNELKDEMRPKMR